MQDVLAEAGLSASAVYRYFPGKEQIVLAIAEEALGVIAGSIVSELETGALLDVRAVIGRLVERYRTEGMLAGSGSTDEVARVITGIVAGFIQQRAVLRDVDAATFRAGLAELLPLSGSRRASRRP